MTLAGAIAVGVVCAAALTAWVAWRRWLGASLPRRRGTAVVEAIGAAVTVRRDRRGWVTIDAASVRDAAFAAGYVHAQERLWQLEMNRRVAFGRISEIAGADGLPADRFLRRIGLHRIAAQEAERIGAETAAMLEAYAAGVNAVITSSRPLPVEFRLLGIRPEPWRPVDSLACFKLLALGLSTNWDHELQRLDLLRQVGPARAAKLDLVFPDATPSILADTAAQAPRSDSDDAVLRLFGEAARWIPAAGGASNSWVVSGARSASGAPLLCNDPHLPPSVPSIWFQAHLRVADDFQTTGVTYPGMPFPIIGHTDSVAWGFTNSFADCQDLVIEDFEDASLRRYRTEKGAVDAQVIREVIRVKAASDEVEEVTVTRHGPIVERLGDPAKGIWRGLALQWTATVPGDAAGALLAAQRARNGDEFRSAFAAFDAPSQNVVWADREGHIGYFLCGRVPVRRREPTGLPVAGWNGDALWERMLQPDEMPAITDPPEGVIVTANNRIVGDTFPHYIATDYMNGYRAQRILELLDAGEPLDASRMNAIQMDMVSPPAREVVRLMRDARGATEAGEKVRRQLLAWDGTMDPSLVAPTLYTLLMERVAEYALAPICGDAWRTVAGIDRHHDVLGYPGNIIGRLTPVLLQHWRDDDAGYLEGRITWPEVVTRALETVAADPRSRRRWGDVHRLPLQHRLAVNRAARRIFRTSAAGVGGDADTVHATGATPGGQDMHARLLAPSWRQIIDVGDWDRSTAVFYPGQSGHPASRNYADLRGAWRRNRQLPLTWSADAVTAATRDTLTLQPRIPVASA